MSELYSCTVASLLDIGVKLNESIYERAKMSFVSDNRTESGIITSDI